MSTRQPGSKLFITLVVETGPAHMFSKKSLTNHMVQLILLFVNMFHLQSWWTEGVVDKGITVQGMASLAQHVYSWVLPPCHCPCLSGWASDMLLKRTLLSLQKA